MALFHAIIQFFYKALVKQKLSILIYHQILPDLDPMRPDEPTGEDFQWQMALISKYFTPMSLSEATKALKEGTLPRDAICVTFDDGYINNLTVAQPVLSTYQVPATVYIATAFSDGENMFNDRIVDLIGDADRAHIDLSAIGLGKHDLVDSEQRINLYVQVIKHLKYINYIERKSLINRLYQDNNATEYARRMMSPAQIIELSELGVEIGAHTVDHPILKTLTEQQQLDQISHSKQSLEALLGKPVRHFAYPNGKLGDDYSQSTRDIVKQLEFETAVSTLSGVSSANTDVFQLKRFTPWDKSPWKFHLRLLIEMWKTRNKK